MWPPGRVIGNVENEWKTKIMMTSTSKLKFLVLFNLLTTVNSCKEVSKCFFHIKCLSRFNHSGNLECDPELCLWFSDNVDSYLGHGQCDQVQWQSDGVHEDKGHGDHECASCCDWRSNKCEDTSEQQVSAHQGQFSLSRNRYWLECVIPEFKILLFCSLRLIQLQKTCKVKSIF